MNRGEGASSLPLSVSSRHPNKSAAAHAAAGMTGRNREFVPKCSIWDFCLGTNGPGPNSEYQSWIAEYDPCPLMSKGAGSVLAVSARW
jgi:hypothetical protein